MKTLTNQFYSENNSAEGVFKIIESISGKSVASCDYKNNGETRAANQKRINDLVKFYNITTSL